MIYLPDDVTSSFYDTVCLHLSIQYQVLTLMFLAHRFQAHVAARWSMEEVSQSLVDDAYLLTEIPFVYKGYYFYPCDADLALSISFSGQKFAIRSEDFNMGRVSEDSKYVSTVILLVTYLLNHFIASALVGSYR